MRFGFLLLLLPLVAHGQGTSFVRRSVAGQPEVQVELAPNQRSYLYFAVGGLRYTDPGSRPADRNLGLDVRYLTLGYEKLLTNSEVWSWGPTLRLASNAGTTAAQPGLSLRHRSQLGPLTIGQRLGAEVALTDAARLDPAYNFNSSFTAPSRLLLRLRLDMYRQGGIQVGDWLNFSPRLAFEPAVFLRLQSATGDPEKRTIDFTALRADAALRFGQRALDVVPWFALQTQYQRTLIQTTPSGTPTSNGRLNILLPTAGLEVRYNLSRATNVGNSFSTSTQH